MHRFYGPAGYCACGDAPEDETYPCAAEYELGPDSEPPAAVLDDAEERPHAPLPTLSEWVVREGMLFGKLGDVPALTKRGAAEGRDVAITDETGEVVIIIHGAQGQW